MSKLLVCLSVQEFVLYAELAGRNHSGARPRYTLLRYVLVFVALWQAESILIAELMR